MIDELFLALTQVLAPDVAPPVPTSPPVIQRSVSGQIPAKAEVPPPVPPVPRSISPTMPSKKWRVATVNGDLYEHEDGAFLQAWVNGENARLIAARQPASFYYPAASSRRCGPGGCP